MKARGRHKRRQNAYERLKKQIDSQKISPEFLNKLPELVAKNKSSDELEIEKYWKRRRFDLSRLAEKGAK